MKYFKKTLFVSAPFIAVFLTGFLLSSGLFLKFANFGFEKARSDVKFNIVNFQLSKLMTHPSARHYFLLPENSLNIDFFEKPIPFPALFTAILNAVFNFLFQPIFFSTFLPQTVLNYLLFPFFIYGAIRYFKKLPIMILFFVGITILIGIKDFIVEPLIRHRMSCEMIYLLIGLAGFIDWITKKLS